MTKKERTASDDAALTALLQDRVRGLNQAPEDPRASFVLLWLQGQRRLGRNLAFSYAQRRANELNKPLVVYEALRHDYPYACDRFHRFVLEGALDNAREAKKRDVAYAFFLQGPDSPRGALHSLAARAAVAVTDWLPHFIYPAQTRAFAARARVRVEVIDAAGVAPLSISDKAEIGARTLRPKIHRRLDELLQAIPEPRARVSSESSFEWGFEPFIGSAPRARDNDKRAHKRIATRAGSGPDAHPSVRANANADEDARLAEEELAIDRAIAALPIDHSVGPVRGLRGGAASGRRQLDELIALGLHGYAENRNQPSLGQTSWLSPFLHFGHLGAGEIALAVKGARAAAADRDSFLEELIVRRELAFNFCARVPAHESTRALPGWALATLQKHESDPRPSLLEDEALERAESPDEIWNAAQRQLVSEGRIHGYLRMLWGKLLLTWSRNAEEAHRRMRWLNDKYALDGRDANSAANFLWCLGLHDRPFPERAIFGTVRSMTSNSTRNKFDMDGYLARFGRPSRTPLDF